MINCIYNDCSLEATHILVNKYHEIVGEIGEEEFYCKEHAFKENREECLNCDFNYIEYEDDPSSETIELLPTYPKGELVKGCCSDHP